MLTRRVWEAELHGQRFFAVGHVACIDNVALGMHPGEREIAVVAIGEGTAHVAFPQVEFLSFRFHECPVGHRNVEADGAQMKPVGIGAQIGGGSLAAFVGKLFYGLHLLVEGVRRAVVLRVRERVPSPVAHRAQRHAVFVVLGESL